jgi:hypothetical protein
MTISKREAKIIIDKLDDYSKKMPFSAIYPLPSALTHYASHETCS